MIKIIAIILSVGFLFGFAYESKAAGNQITQEELRQYFSQHRVGRSPDYGLVKNGDDYLATFHSYWDDKDACESVVSSLGNQYSCVQLNTSREKKVSHDELRKFFFKNMFSQNRVGRSPDYGLVKNGDDYLATFHSYWDDKDACESYVSSLGNQYSCAQLNN